MILILLACDTLPDTGTLDTGAPDTSALLPDRPPAIQPPPGGPWLVAPPRLTVETGMSYTVPLRGRTRALSARCYDPAVEVDLDLRAPADVIGDGQAELIVGAPTPAGLAVCELAHAGGVEIIEVHWR
jgi:hypothetical protein